ncbi:MAG: ComEC/Rec2 family competence protein [Oscillospiraceae bacterium]
MCDTVPSYEDNVGATLLVKEISGAKPLFPFKVNVTSMQRVKSGDLVEMELSFIKNSSKGSLLYNYSKGIYVSAKPKRYALSISESNDILSVFRRIQAKLGLNIKTHIKNERGNIAAAISVGDKAGLSYLTKEEFKIAGVSHILVVSGMHLSAAGAASFAIGKLFLKRRKAAILGITVTVLFMLLMGFTPSVVRAGVGLILVYVGIICSKVSDTVTSLGLAALILSIANPFATLDIGLLLSFTATLGILACIYLMQKLKQLPFFDSHRLIYKCISFVAVPVFAALATLPIQLVFGMGVSLLCVLCNLLCVPLVPATTLSAFALSVIPPQFTVIAYPFKLVCSACIYALQLVTHIASLVPWGFVHIGGEAAVIVLLLYLLFYIGMRFSVKNLSLYMAALALIGVSLQMLLSYGLVRIELADYSKAPAVLLCQKGKSALIIQGTATPNYINKAMQRQNISCINTVIDLRIGKEHLAPIGVFYNEYINAEKEILNNAEICISDDIIVYIKRQNKGIAACVDIKSYKLALNSGYVNFFPYSNVDAYIAGNVKPKGLFAKSYIYGADMQKWLVNEYELPADKASKIIVRPLKSARIYTSIF